ncbi:MAG: type IV pilus assembly protein PilM [Proteobacteria bacterium]|nr:MAG: type IV pilus assembly protein PilM [Pseudomonadota bacterium]
MDSATPRPEPPSRGIRSVRVPRRGTKMLFGLGAKPIIGLDIGSSTIKLVEAEKKRGGWVVKSFTSVTLPEDTIVDGEIVNHAAVVEAIRSVIKESGAGSKLVATSVAGSSVIIKHINIPHTAPKELEDQVYWEAEQYIPFDMKDISLDFEVVQEDAGEGKMDILLVAAKKDFIEKRLAAIRECGLNPEVLDIDVLALANVFWENYEMTPDNAVVLVDIGASLTKINIVSDTTTIFTRDVAIGGKNLTQEIQNRLGISFQEAEVLKIDACSTGQIPEEVLPLVQQISENVSLEIRRSLDFYAASPVQLPVTAVFLCGGASRIPGLANMLSEMLGLPIEYLNPFNKVACSGKQFNEEFLSAISSSAAVPLGLALRNEA